LTLVVTYYLKLRADRYNELLGPLGNLGFKVLRAEDTSSTAVQNNPTELVCSKNFADDEISKSLDNYTFLQNLDGIDTVLVMPEQKKSKKMLIPFSISSTITFLVIMGALYQVIENVTASDILLIAGIPTVVTFMSQLLYGYFKGN